MSVASVMSNTEIFEYTKGKILQLKDERVKNQLLNSLMLALTLDSKKFQKRAKEIYDKVREVQND